MTASIERLRPLSSAVLVAAYQLTMSKEIERAFGRELTRLTKRKRAGRRAPAPADRCCRRAGSGRAALWRG
ncbi:MAG: hypothetical protein ACLQMH_13225 [Solirubrobacteraceae bacterium]